MLEAQKAKEFAVWEAHCAYLTQPHREVALLPSGPVPGIQSLQSRGELTAPPGTAARVLERKSRSSGGAGATTPTLPLLVGSRPHTPAGSEAISSEMEQSRPRRPRAKRRYPRVCARTSELCSPSVEVGPSPSLSYMLATRLWACACSSTVWGSPRLRPDTSL